MNGHKSIGIIGAGQAGLTSLKTLKEYGFQVTAFESNSDIGGLWNYEANKTNMDCPYEEIKNLSDPLNTTYATLRLNTSVWSNCFSDFPLKDSSYEEFMTHTQFLNYLKSYAKKYDLMPLIEFNALVTKVNKAISFPGWIIQYEKNKMSYKQHFDYIVVASGAFRNQKLPKIPGLSDFKGLVLQSNQIRDPMAIFENKTVFVIGGSVTGADLTCNALKAKAKHVYLSATSRPGKRNRWFSERYPKRHSKEDNDCNRPWDMQTSRFVNDQFEGNFLKSVEEFMMPFLMKDSDLLEEPNIGVDAWMVADTKTLLAGINNEKLQCVNSVEKITSDEIILADGHTIADVDVVVVATGFTKQFPFLNNVWSYEEQQQYELYKHILPVSENMDGIALIGLTGAPVGYMVVAEMQARWLGEAWKDAEYDERGHLYSTEERTVMKDHFTQMKSKSIGMHKFLWDPIRYLDELANFVGCETITTSSQLSTAIKNSKTIREVAIAVAIWYGPFICSQYRLNAADREVKYSAESTLLKVSRKYLGKRFDELVQYYNAGKFLHVEVSK